MTVTTISSVPDKPDRPSDPNCIAHIHAHTLSYAYVVRAHLIATCPALLPVSTSPSPSPSSSSYSSSFSSTLQSFFGLSLSLAELVPSRLMRHRLPAEDAVKPTPEFAIGPTGRFPILDSRLATCLGLGLGPGPQCPTKNCGPGLSLKVKQTTI